MLNILYILCIKNYSYSIYMKNQLLSILIFNKEPQLSIGTSSCIFWVLCVAQRTVKNLVLHRYKQPCICEQERNIESAKYKRSGYNCQAFSFIIFFFQHLLKVVIYRCLSRPAHSGNCSLLGKEMSMGKYSCIHFRANCWLLFIDYGKKLLFIRDFFARENQKTVYHIYNVCSLSS